MGFQNTVIFVNKGVSYHLLTNKEVIKGYLVVGVIELHIYQK